MGTIETEEMIMESFNTYEEVVDYFLKNTPCGEYPYGNGIGLYSKVGDLGGVIEVLDNGVISVWSGLGFEDYQFKTRVNSPQQAYELIKVLLGDVAWEVEED